MASIPDQRGQHDIGENQVNLLAGLLHECERIGWRRRGQYFIPFPGPLRMFQLVRPSLVWGHIQFREKEMGGGTRARFAFDEDVAVSDEPFSASDVENVR